MRIVVPVHPGSRGPGRCLTGSVYLAEVVPVQLGTHGVLSQNIGFSNNDNDNDNACMYACMCVYVSIYLSLSISLSL